MSSVADRTAEAGSWPVTRPTRAEIDLDAVTQNVRVLRAFVGVTVAAVVKANGYGHGAVPVARAALAGGAGWLAVASVHEALALRRAGLDAPVLVLGWTPPEALPVALDHDLRLTVVDPADVAAAARAGAAAGRPARLHVKIDTGMGRLGFPAWDPETPRRLLELAGTPGVEVEGIYTHLASADLPDPGDTHEQLRRFRQVLEALARGGLRPPLIHAANSAGALRFPEARFDLVRVGLAIYGLTDFAVPPGAPGLRPALRWVTRVAQVKTLPPGIGVSYGRTYVPDRPLRTAILPVGYADGFDRGLSNRGEVLVGGRRARVLGRVCMDQTVVGPVDEAVRPGDEAVLIGRQGGDEVSAAEVAAWLDTIPYEVVARIGPRVARVYPGPGGGEPVG